MFQSMRRFAIISLFTVLAASTLVGQQPDADAGLATSVGLVANVSYTGPTTDLIVSFRLLLRSTGAVLWQADPADISAVHTDATRIRFSTSLIPGDWWYSSSYEWSCRIDARDATSSVYWVDYKQWVDSVSYWSTVPTSNIEGRTSEALVLGQVKNSYL